MKFVFKGVTHYGGWQKAKIVFVPNLEGCKGSTIDDDSRWRIENGLKGSVEGPRNVTHGSWTDTILMGKCPRVEKSSQL